MGPNAATRGKTGYLLVALAACTWGTWPFFLRRAEAVAPIPAALESVIAMGVFTAVSGPLCLVDRVPTRASRTQWAGLVWLGIGDAMNVFLFFAAYQHTSVAIAVLTHYLTPILVAIGAPFVLDERVRARTFFAVLVSFTGLVLLLRPWSADRHAGDWVGAALGTGSAVFYASNVLVNKRITRAFSGSELSFYHGLVATPLLATLVPLAAWTGLWTGVGATARALAMVGVGAIFAGAGGGLLFVWGLKRIDASHASALTLLEPLVAVGLAAALLREPLGFDAALGAVLVLAGAAMVVSSGASRSRGGTEPRNLLEPWG